MGHAGDEDFSIRGAEWTVFWQRLRRRLLQDGYRPGTHRVYRQVLRDLRAFLRRRYGIVRPEGITPQTAESYLVFLSQKNVSWSWMARAIAVLRTAFDKLGGMAVTARMAVFARNPHGLTNATFRLQPQDLVSVVRSW